MDDTTQKSGLVENSKLDYLNTPDIPQQQGEFEGGATPTSSSNQEHTQGAGEKPQSLRDKWNKERLEAQNNRHQKLLDLRMQLEHGGGKAGKEDERIEEIDPTNSSRYKLVTQGGRPLHERLEPTDFDALEAKAEAEVQAQKAKSAEELARLNSLSSDLFSHAFRQAKRFDNELSDQKAEGDLKGKRGGVKAEYVVENSSGQHFAIEVEGKEHKQKIGNQEIVSLFTVSNATADIFKAQDSKDQLARVEAEFAEGKPGKQSISKIGLTFSHHGAAEGIGIPFKYQYWEEASTAIKALAEGENLDPKSPLMRLLSINKYMYQPEFTHLSFSVNENNPNQPWQIKAGFNDDFMLGIRVRSERMRSEYDPDSDRVLLYEGKKDKKNVILAFTREEVVTLFEQLTSLIPVNPAHNKD